MTGLRARWRALVSRLRRVERRELREFRAWLETTRNLVHLTVLVVVPLVVAAVTAVSNTESLLPFVLFPPLASGTYTLFSDPEGRYASPVRFVGGLTAGALCGSVAVVAARLAGLSATATATGGLDGVSPTGAALAIFLTGGATWAFDVEEPAAFSTALLALIAPALAGGPATGDVLVSFVASVFVGSCVVAGVFYAWREGFYERRAEFLYHSTNRDDRVLVPVRGDRPDPTVLLGARLAAAHDAGKVVLLDVVADEDIAEARRDILRDEGSSEELLESPPERDGSDGTGAPDGSAVDEADLAAAAEERAAATTATEMEALADRVQTDVGVPCEVVVAVESGSPAATVEQAVHEANCDLIVTPYEERYGRLSPFVHDLFRGDTDVLVHRPGAQSRTHWRDVLVPVRGASDAAHTMLDFAIRLSGPTGRVAVCTCIDESDDRRRAESMLSNLVDAFSGPLETRVVRQRVERFLSRTAPQFDLVVIGASRDRSKASRFVSPPTFERIQELDADVAILDRNYRF